MKKTIFTVFACVLILGACLQFGRRVQAQATCSTIPWFSPETWGNPNTRPAGQVFLDAWNTAPTHSQGVDTALRGGESAYEQLSQYYVALQFSLMRANRSSFAGSLACQGVNIGTVKLASGEIITGATTIDELIMITRNAFRRSDAGDMQLVIMTMRLLFTRDLRYAPPSSGSPISTPPPAPPQPCFSFTPCIL